MRALVVVAVLALFGGLPYAAAEETPSAIDPVIHILDVRLGTHVDSKKRVPVPYQSFRPSEPKIVASVHTTVKSGALNDASIGALWTFDTSEGPQTVIDASAELEFEGEGYTVFEISNTKPWPVGKYHLTIYIEGIEVSRTSFYVK